MSGVQISGAKTYLAERFTLLVIMLLYIDDQNKPSTLASVQSTGLAPKFGDQSVCQPSAHSDLGKVEALSVNITQQALLAHLTTQPALLEAREICMRVGQLEDVDVDGPGLEFPGDALRACEVLRVHRSCETCVVQVRTA